MRAHLSLCLAILLLLGACATVPESAPEAALPQTDNSRPNTASLYFFLTGSYLYYTGDFPTADQVLNLALAQDPSSPQIRKMLFVNSARWYSLAQDEASEQTVRQMLVLARKSYDFDEEMLVSAYISYRHLQDREGEAWALKRLLNEHPKAQVYIWEYLWQIDSGGKPDFTLLEKALSAERNIPQVDYLVASLYSQHKPQRAIQILEASERSLAGDQQLLMLYLNQGRQADLRKHFSCYEYPEDKTKISDYLLLLHENGLSDIALEHLEQILASRDAYLLEVICYIAFMSGDLDTLNELKGHLQAQLPAPSEDSKTVSILLMQALNDPAFELPLDLMDRINGLQDLIQATYLYVSQDRYASDREEDFQSAFRDLHQAVDRLMPPSLIKSFLLDHSASLANIYDAGSQTAVALAEDMIKRGLGDREDVYLLLDYYQTAGDQDKQLWLLRQSHQRFPNDPMIMNNLGYILLDDPDSLPEAERLITEALRREPESVNMIDSMAWLRYRQAKYDAAYSYLPRMLNSEEQSAELLYHAGMIALSLGHEDEAIGYFKSALDLPDDADFHERCRRELEGLEQRGGEGR